jgi:DNA-binding Lrp family transcriptional regulator
MSKNSREQIEQDEKKILSELVKNSKENIDTIAKNCGFSRQKTWRMMKQLETSQKIWGYSAVVDSEKQGLQKFMLFFKRTNEPIDSKDLNEIAVTRLDPMKKNLGITVLSSYYIHGDFDWVTIFTAEDILQAKQFANALVERFSHAQTLSMSQILFTVRENCVENPNIKEIRKYL